MPNGTLHLGSLCDSEEARSQRNAEEVGSEEEVGASGEGGCVRGGRLVRGLLGSEVAVLPSRQVLNLAVKEGPGSRHPGGFGARKPGSHRFV